MASCGGRYALRCFTLFSKWAVISEIKICLHVFDKFAFAKFWPSAKLQTVDCTHTDYLALQACSHFVQPTHAKEGGSCLFNHFFCVKVSIFGPQLVYTSYKRCKSWSSFYQEYAHAKILSKDDWPVATHVKSLALHCTWYTYWPFWTTLCHILYEEWFKELSSSAQVDPQYYLTSWYQIGLTIIRYSCISWTDYCQLAFFISIQISEQISSGQISSLVVFCTIKGVSIIFPAESLPTLPEYEHEHEHGHEYEYKHEYEYDHPQ